MFFVFLLKPESWKTATPTVVSKTYAAAAAAPSIPLNVLLGGKEEVKKKQHLRMNNHKRCPMTIHQIGRAPISLRQERTS